jgi:hypothetical protein
MSKEPPQIFVSHSRRDTKILDFFDRAFARTGVISKCMEFEEMQPPQWNEIDKQVETSIATFLLLGPNVKNSDHTRNWIAFEVGLSCAYKKRVWVFEEMDSKINFPIPYVTDYMPYVLNERISFDYIREILEGYRDDYYQVNNGKRIPIGLETICWNCRAVFYTHQTIGAHYCPVCRTYSIPKK